MKTAKIYITLIIIVLISSCAEEQFAPKRQEESPVVTATSTSITSTCSTYSLIKPKVDFLFLWDNSTSSVFINSSTKAALNGTINRISADFDYHIMLAPLTVPTSASVNYEAKIMTETPTGLSSSALGMKIDRSLASTQLDSFSSAPGSYEEGVSRSVDVIKANISNGVFRPNTHLVVVVMSNGDDSSWHKYPVADADRQAYTDEQTKQLLCLRGSYTPTSGVCTGSSLNSIQLRFMSITAFNQSGSCGGIASWQKGTTYQEVSKNVYTARLQQIGNNSTYDSYDICSQSNFAYIFDGINESIDGTLLKHKYDYWPIATSGSAAIDPNEVYVYKDGTSYPQLTPPVTPGASGFTYLGFQAGQDTRYEPTVGEPFTGYMVQLHGNARVTYPECIRVQTQTPKEYFGYVQLQAKPLESSIQLSINGATIPNSSTNGWELVKSGGTPTYYPSFNIKIQSPTSFCPVASTSYCTGSPAVNKSGYFLKLNGSAVYSNGAQISLTYDPSA